MSVLLRHFSRIIPAALLILLALPGIATEDCEIFGTIIAEINDANPEMGAWRYRLVVTWNTGSQYGLSHIDLIIDDGNCACEELIGALNWDDPIGFSMESPTHCSVFYYGEIVCDEEPSIPVAGTVLKFEPYETGDCEPGTGGIATFTFYSNYPPAPIAEPNLFVVDKHAGYACYGPITGDFPSIPCDPLPTEAESWGTVKSDYGH